jgi:hypothetical protein
VSAQYKYRHVTVSSKSHPRRNRKEERVEGKEKGSYLSLIPELYMEDKMN